MMVNPRRGRLVLVLAGCALCAAPAVPQERLPVPSPAPRQDRPRLFPNLRRDLQPAEQPPMQGQQPAAPRLEPVAETKLLMEGLARANFRGLERLLTKEPPDVETWTFARGQALLLAETGNLLLIRPPRTPGPAQTAWMTRAEELRTAATRLARLAGQKNFEGSRAALAETANVCNRCHQAFRIAVTLTAFGPDAAP